MSGPLDTREEAEFRYRQQLNSEPDKDSPAPEAGVPIVKPTSTAEVIFESAVYRIEVVRPSPSNWEADPNGYYRVVNRDTGLIEARTAQLPSAFKFVVESEQLIGQVRQMLSPIKRVGRA